MNAGLLRQRLAQALTVPGVGRRVKAPVSITRPKVTQAQLAHKYPVLLVADRTSFKLRLYKQLTLVKEYTVAVGAIGFDTPAGLYHIQNKEINPTWHVPNSAWAGDLAGTTVPGGVPDNPLKARWLGIFDGAGIHGTDETYSLGHAASHGCIRMAIPDVIELYDQVPVGAPDLHRLRGHSDLGDWHLFPAALLQQVLALGVSNAERADEDATLALAEDRVPHRRGVAGPLDRVPGRLRLAELVDHAGLGQLTAASRPVRPAC